MINLSIILLTLFTTLNGTQQSPVPFTTLQNITSEEKQTANTKQLPKHYEISSVQFVAQSFNNCGPSSLSMALSTYGEKVTQEELANQTRPFNNPYGGIDDKSVFPDELVSVAKKYHYTAVYRPNGNITLLEKFVANDIPVIIRTWLNPKETIGHYRIVKGYDIEKQEIIADDSYQGSNLSYTYDETTTMWQPFNYGYVIVFPSEKQAVVDAILAEEKNEKVAWRHALSRAEKELEDNPDNPYVQLNRSTAFFHLGDYKNAVAAYELAKDTLPDHILWYQLEPLLAYQKVGEYDRIFEITDAILTHGNAAYSELYQIRGEIELIRRNKNAAKEEFEKAAYYNSTFIPAQQALAKI